MICFMECQQFNKHLFGRHSSTWDLTRSLWTRQGACGQRQAVWAPLSPVQIPPHWPDQAVPWKERPGVRQTSYWLVRASQVRRQTERPRATPAPDHHIVRFSEYTCSHLDIISLLRRIYWLKIAGFSFLLVCRCLVNPTVPLICSPNEGCQILTSHPYAKTQC